VHVFAHGNRCRPATLIAEPLFQKLCSTVQLIPVMNADDLQQGLAELARTLGCTMIADVSGSSPRTPSR
jgi:hypothetical protein